MVSNTGEVTTSNAGSDQSSASTCVQALVDLSVTETGSPSPDHAARKHHLDDGGHEQRTGCGYGRQDLRSDAVSPKQLFVGRKTKLTIYVTKKGKAVKGVRVKIKGPKLYIRTKPSNH